MAEIFTTKKFSKDFGIHPVAMAILMLLDEFEISGLVDEEHKNNVKYLIDLRTSAWYNGRERGICLCVDLNGTSFVITFGECRNSDSIFVDSWIMKSSLNPPTVADFTDEAYSNRKYFSYNGIYEATQHIDKLIKDRFAELIPTLVDKVKK